MSTNTFLILLLLLPVLKLRSLCPISWLYFFNSFLLKKNQNQNIRTWSGLLVSVKDPSGNSMF